MYVEFSNGQYCYFDKTSHKKLPLASSIRKGYDHIIKTTKILSQLM